MRTAPRKAARQRLSPDERRQHLIAAATTYFAEVGFGGSTHELARRIGVTQPLLYRYFTTKDSLIQAVYEAVYLRRWRAEWTALLQNRALSLRERLEQFYRSYDEVAFTPDWIRIYLFSSLRSATINKSYTSLIETRVLAVIIRELYAEGGHPPPIRLDGGSMQIELAWSLHSALFYYAVRRHIYAIPVHDDRDAVIAQTVDMFLRGAGPLIAAMTETSAQPQPTTTGVPVVVASATK